MYIKTAPIFKKPSGGSNVDKQLAQSENAVPLIK